MADARTWGPAKRVRVVCRCGRKLDQGPPWEYETKPDGLSMRFRYDECGFDYPMTKQQINGQFKAAWMAALRELGPQRVIRLPL